jgi:signal transduction histidine kinase/ligand-binding sensor domain-containing protein
MMRWLRRCQAVVAGALLLWGATAATAEHIVLESFQEREGLTGLTPNCLVQDGHALLWVCTDNGLFRFDGFRMRREPLPPESSAGIQGARVDREGRLWVSTEGGLFIRQEEAGGVRWAAVRKPDGRMLGMRRSRQLDWDDGGVAYLMDGDKQLWSIAAGAAGAVVARPLAQPPVPGRPGVVSPVRWYGGALWFGCGDGLCEWRDGQLKSWGPDQGLPADGWANLHVARDGSLWARSGRWLARLARGAEQFEAVKAPTVVGAWINFVSLVEDRDGAILTTTDKGVARWDGNAWREWTRLDGLPDTGIRALSFDAEGSLWLGAGGRGVYRWVGYGQAHHWTREDGLPSNVVTDLQQDGSGRLWAATREGVAWFDEAGRRFVTPEMPGAQGVHSWRWMMVTDGDLWWIENDRLFTVKAGSTKVRLVTRDPLFAGAVMGSHAYYVFGPGGVERLTPEGEGLRREWLGALPPGGERVMAVAHDGRSEWFISDGRVLRWKDGAWASLVDTAGVPVPAYLDLMFDPEGRLWIIDGTGVRQYAVTDGVARLLRRFPPELFGGAVPCIVRSTADGRVWIGTDQGVFILDPDGGWRHLHHGNGLVWNDVDPGFLIDTQGHAWIATSAGVTRLNAGVPQQLRQPVLRVDQVEFGAQVFFGPPTRPVPWVDRRLRVTLGTANYSLARSLRIEYRLGPDMPWRTAESAVLDVGALEAGVQLLQVRAVGLTPAEPPGPVLSMPFEVRPPWWQTPAARATGALALVLLWWGSWWALQRRARARSRELEQAITERTAELEASRAALRRLGEHNARSLEEERKRVSRELHDELGQQLVALRMEVSVASKRAAIAGGSVTPEHLAPMLARMDQLVATMRNLVSQLRPPALDGGLLAALRWLASEFSRGTGMDCTVEAEADLRELSPDLATMVFRIAQESLNNARRHAQASHVELRLTQDDGQWLLTVRDDGVGFDPAHRQHGYGLLGMEERARLLGGQLQVDSAPGRGTEVRLRFTTPASPSADTSA